MRSDLGHGISLLLLLFAISEALTAKYTKIKFVFVWEIISIG